MPRALWPLHHGRPCIEVVLTLTASGQNMSRVLLADTGAGTVQSPFQLVLDEDDCLLCGGFSYVSVTIRGAYSGAFPMYDLPVRIPALGFDEAHRVAAVANPPAGFDGIACFNFLNRFTYGNFGDAGQFGLEA